MSRIPVLLFPVLLSTACARDRASTAPPPADDAGRVTLVNPVAAALARDVVLDADNPRTCAACHTAVVAEWEASQHARAHHSNDALYAAMRTLREQKQGAHIPAACATCHNPRDDRDHDSAAARTGVSCATCHELAGVHADHALKGAGALVRGPGRLFRGPHDLPNGVSPVHGNGPALPPLADGRTLCLACHGEEHNPAGVATCSTGTEHAQWKDGASCTSCHMEEVAGPSGPVSSRTTHRSHRFAGPHHARRSGDLAFMASAVRLSGRFNGNRFTAVMENRAGHAFPTGFPGRVAVLGVVARDAGGMEVFRNVSADPMKEHPDAVLNRAYVDKAGNPALAPFAEKQVRDTRLQPGETRQLHVDLPASAATVELRLRFLPAAPGLVKALAFQGPEATPLDLPPVTVTR